MYMIFFRDGISLITRNILFTVKCFKETCTVISLYWSCKSELCHIQITARLFNEGTLKDYIFSSFRIEASVIIWQRLLWLVTNCGSLHFPDGTDQLYFMIICIYALSELLLTLFLLQNSARARTWAAPWSNSLPDTGLGTSIGARVVCQPKLPWSLYGSWDVLASNKWHHYVWCVSGEISLCVMCEW
jgi:hypothetical protein